MEKPAKKNIHAGHRERLRQRYLHEGLDNFPPHNVLELLLFFAIPQRDTNDLAHELLERFGSLSGVFDARVDELFAVKGMTKNAAILLHMMPELFRRYSDSKSKAPKRLNSPEVIAEFLRPKFVGRSREAIYLLCLDKNCNLLRCDLISEGGVDEAKIDARELVEAVFGCGASSVVMAHNHPSGEAYPTKQDLSVTRVLQITLRPLGIDLVDHLIVTDTEVCSMMELGFLGMQNVVERKIK